MAAPQPAKLLLFWDYDTQWGADRSRSAGGPKQWGALEFENTDRLLELHSSYDVPACFAAVGAAAKPGERPYHDPGQIRRIHNAGHEIASHSYRHDWLPGLNQKELIATLSESKAALEDCIGESVVSFVPPYNQPFDFPKRGSISIAERRTARPYRTGLGTLCRALAETGYRFCRVAYRPWTTRLMEAISGKRLDRPAQVESIGGVCCIRLNTPGGFAGPTLKMLERCRKGDYVVAYGHPHSITSGNSQDHKYLIPFFERVKQLRESGRLEVIRPKDVLFGTVDRAVRNKTITCAS
jgi:Polysaccharide deacetylase